MNIIIATYSTRILHSSFPFFGSLALIHLLMEREYPTELYMERETDERATEVELSLIHGH